jgi:RimJ/RimL family protein N-acetyltransferase
VNIPVPIIETERFVIRPYAMSDTHPLHRMMKENKNDLLHTFPLSVSGTATVMRTRKYILAKQAERKSGLMLVCGVFDAATENLFGHVLFTKFDWTVPKCDMGYFIEKSRTGKGIGTEVAKRFSEWGFRTLKLEKITMRIWPENHASVAVAKKLKAREIGIAKRDFRSHDGKVMDCAIYELYR